MQALPDLLGILDRVRIVVAGGSHRLFLLLALGHLLLLFLRWSRLVVHRSILARVGTLAGWKFCPRCRSELDAGDGRVACGVCGFTFYASSVPTASALCTDGDGRVLLARRAHDPDRDKWDLPGGFLDESEHPIDALRRELREETGLEVEPQEFFGVWMDRYGDGDSAPVTLNLYWTARLAGGEPEPADDVAELRWFAPGALPPPAELAFENNAKVLAAWRERNPGA